MRLVRTLAGLSRSWRIYRTDPAHGRALDALHARFIGKGDLVFDIGAHVGDRVASFRRLGARVVAVEPQVAPATLIRLLHVLDPQVSVVQGACGRQEGRATLKVNTDNPTVSTLSTDFVAAAHGARGWADQVWDTDVEVRTTTLDALIREHGEPAFVKIDVEGFEEEVLAGLSRPLRMLSFEFTTIGRDVSHRAIARLRELGDYRYNFSLGETQELLWPDFVPDTEIERHLDALPHEANSGDVYARLAG